MKKLIFDFDGTLVDSMPQWAGKMLSILDKNNISYPKDIIKIITPLGDKGAAEYFVSELGLKLSVEEIVEDINDFAMKDYAENILTKETVPETLIKLKEIGYSLNVLTASPHIMLDICLIRNGIYDLFDNIWSCDDFNMKKSDVNIYYSVAEKLNTTTDNCVLLDDSIGALTTAKKAGMNVVGVYDESAADSEAEIRELTSRYIYKLSEYLE